jgi:hypothetical protein
MYAFMYVCNACVCMCVCMHACMYMRMYVCLYVCVSFSLCVCTCVWWGWGWHKRLHSYALLGHGNAISLSYWGHTGAGHGSRRCGPS